MTVGVASFVRLSDVVPLVPVPLLSLAVSRSRDVGALEVVSIVIASAPDVVLVLSAGSTVTTVRLWIPSASALPSVIVHVPSLATCAVGDTAAVLPPNVSEIVTRLPASPVPVITGVVTLVRSSLVVPVVPVPDVSLATDRSSVGVAVVMSTVTDSAVEAPLTLPAASVEVAVSECTPSARVVVVIDQVPVPPATPLIAVFEAVTVPRTVVTPLIVPESVTVLPASEVPVTTGVWTFVRSSDVVPVVPVPALSLAVDRSRIVGTVGVTST